MSVKYQEHISDTPRKGRWFHDAMTISHSSQDVFDFWGAHEHWPMIMPFVNRAKMGDKDAEYEVKAQVYSSRPDESWTIKFERWPDVLEMSWLAYREETVVHQGRVEFKTAPKDRGTEVHLHCYFRFAGGSLTHFLSKVAGKNPDRVMRESLRRLKAYLEAGEIPTIQGQPRGAEAKVEKRAKPENIETQSPIVAEL